MNRDSIFDLTKVKYIQRIVIGNDNPERLRTEEELEKQLAILNKCLVELPKGHIIGTEKNFYLLSMGEHQVVVQYILYHVGFERKPSWL